MVFFLIFIIYSIFISSSSYGVSIAKILIIYVNVILHEYGHALTARYYNIKVNDIVIHIVGGAANIEEDITKEKEFWITLFGPLVNFIICLICLPFILYEIDIHDIIKFIFMSNFILFIFNMIPAWPLDGGRILRSLLSFKFTELAVVNITVTFSQILAIIVPIIVYLKVGFSLNIIFIFCFVFIYSTIYKREKIKSIKHDIETENYILSIKNSAIEMLNTGKINHNELVDGKFYCVKLNTRNFYINLFNDTLEYYYD